MPGPRYRLTYPANFMLVSAMNPCPCGFATDPRNECSCTPLVIQRYMSRISGPLLDRIDIHVEVPAVKIEELSRKAEGESSEAIRGRVEAARERQQARYGGEAHIFANAHLGSQELRRYCPPCRGGGATHGGYQPAGAVGPGLRPHHQGGPHHRRPGR